MSAYSFSSFLLDVVSWVTLLLFWPHLFVVAPRRSGEEKQKTRINGEEVRRGRGRRGRGREGGGGGEKREEGEEREEGGGREGGGEGKRGRGGGEREEGVRTLP